MKRIAWLLLALALFTCALASAEEPVAMRIVSCPEQGFATLCKPEYDYYFTDDGGILIELGPQIEDPYVQIFKTDAPSADFDAEYFLTNIFRKNIADAADQVLNMGEYTTVTFGGKTLPALMMLYVMDGESRYAICAYDLQADYFVHYEMGCAGADTAIEQGLTALAVAVGNFQPDANYYSN